MPIISNLPNGDSPGEVYSKEEICIGTWIDGKPLYRQVFDCTTPSETGDKVVVSTENNKSVVNISGMFLWSTNQWFSINTANTLKDYQIQLQTYYRRGDIIMSALSGAFSKEAHVILEYTKTTDTGNN